MTTAPAPQPTLLSRRLAWQRHERDASRTIDLRVRLLASFTVQPLAAYLGTALSTDGFDPEVTVGPFDQIRQELLGEPSPDTSDADVVVVWARLEDLRPSSPAPLQPGDAADVTDALVSLGELCVDRAAAWGKSFVVVLPSAPHLRPLGVGDAANVDGVGASASQAREALRRTVAGCPGVLVFDADEVIRTLGTRVAIDDRRLASASIPYTEEAFALAGDRLANLIRIARRGARKVAVVDADNTLWGGVIGEDGVDGIDLAEQGPGVSFRQFQRYLLDLRRAGMLVAMASKNNEADAFAAFGRRDMVLRQEDLAAWRVDWRPKSSNIAEMADELNLGTASMVFVDDSAMERAEVSASLPDVAVLAMPEDPAGWVRAIAESGALDRLPPTSSDLGRAESYAQETRRRQSRAATDLGSFLESLHLVVEIFPPQTGDLARLAQLVAKTNQFTLGGSRHSEAELAKLVVDPSAVVRLVSARDDFGDYGVVGALILRPSADDVHVLDTFVLSCRAMGRGVEDAMLSEAVTLSGNRLAVTVVETPKNRPLRAWLERTGVSLTEPHVVSEAAWPGHVARALAP